MHGGAGCAPPCDTHWIEMGVRSRAAFLGHSRERAGFGRCGFWSRLPRFGHNVHVATEGPVSRSVGAGVLVGHHAVGGPAAWDARLERGARGVDHLAVDDVDEQGGELARLDVCWARRDGTVQLLPHNFRHGGFDKIPVHVSASCELDGARVADHGDHDGSALGVVGHHVPEFSGRAVGILGEGLAIVPVLRAVDEPIRAGEAGLGHAPLIGAQVPEARDGLAAGAGVGAVVRGRIVPSRIEAVRITAARRVHASQPRRETLPGAAQPLACDACVPDVGVAATR